MHDHDVWSYLKDCWQKLTCCQDVMPNLAGDERRRTNWLSQHVVVFFFGCVGCPSISICSISSSSAGHTGASCSQWTRMLILMQKLVWHGEWRHERNLAAPTLSHCYIYLSFACGLWGWGLSPHSTQLSSSSRILLIVRPMTDVLISVHCHCAIVTSGSLPAPCSVSITHYLNNVSLLQCNGIVLFSHWPPVG